MMKWATIWLAGVAGAIGLVATLAVSVAALEVPSAPSLDAPIVDQTNTLSSSDKAQLSAQIAELRKQKDFQIGILLISTLGTDSLEDYSIRVARQWGIGEKPKNSGILLLIVKDDRKLRIEVGSGQEGDLTDARSSRIIRNTITPQFREGNYVAGIGAGVAEIAAAIQSQPEKAATSGSENTGEWIGTAIFFGFIVLSWLASILGRSKSWWAGGVIGAGIGAVVAFFAAAAVWSIVLVIFLTVGGLLFDFVVSRNYKEHRSIGDSPAWWAGGDWFGGGGSGSGGGGSFGGGGFSGGGSSGSW